MKIGFIGTGVMGAPMAIHLSKNYDVSVYNRTLIKAQKLKPHVHVYENIVDLIKNSDVIISIVGYPKDVEETYELVFKHGTKGLIAIDMTTSSPSLAKKMYQKGKALGMHLLDIPVTGGDTGARNQTLTMMAGGDEAVFNEVLPIIKSFGTHIFYMGPAGSGQYAKLANQIAIASNIMGLAESLAFAQHYNLNLENQLAILKSGSASSFQANIFGQKMIDKDYQPGFYVKHFMKDLRLVLEENQNHLPLDITQTVLSAYEVLEETHNNLGTQSIFDYYLKQHL